jgi:hypothetical protein
MRGAIAYLANAQDHSSKIINVFAAQRLGLSSRFGTCAGSRSRIYSLLYSGALTAAAVGPLLASIIFWHKGDKWDSEILQHVMLVGMVRATPLDRSRGNKHTQTHTHTYYYIHSHLRTQPMA